MWCGIFLLGWVIICLVGAVSSGINLYKNGHWNFKKRGNRISLMVAIVISIPLYIILDYFYEWVFNLIGC